MQTSSYLEEGAPAPSGRAWRSSREIISSVSVAALLAITAASAAKADEASVAKLEKEMHRIEKMHQAEIRALQAQIKKMRYMSPAHYAGPVVKGPGAYEPPMPFVIMSKGHQFGLSSPDGLNTIEFTGRVHLDTGGYVNYRPDFLQPVKNLGSPIVNFRRARIGVVGKFMGDWNYGLIYDFGGSSDGFAVPGGGASGIENAFLTYKGFANHHQPFPVVITIGAIDVPWTLGEAVGSNDLLMMERPTPQVMATSFGGGDNRTSLGFTSNDAHYFFGAWLTGPTTGALHTAGTAGGPQYSFLTRAAYTFTPTPVSTLHIGVNYANLFAPRAGANTSGYAFGDRPEVRLDPTSLFTIGTVPVSGGQVIGGEAAASYQNAFIMGEYFHYMLDSKTGTTPVTLAGGAPGPTITGDGGYVEASYTFGGKRHYNKGRGGYSGVVPEHPLAWGSDGWGALEVAGTFSVVDFKNANLSTAVLGPAYTGIGPAGSGPYGGAKQTAFGGGLNWYPNLNIKFMLDYEHVTVDRPSFFGGATTKGATVDWVAARTQFVW